MIDGASVNVRDFGAVGDGVTDDTAAIQAAINFCTNLNNRKQTLYFPANDAAAAYKVTAPLVINGRLNIVGDGRFSTLILAVGLSSSDHVLDFDCDAADVIYYCGVSNIRISSNNNGPVGMRIKNVSYMTVKEVTLTGLSKGVVCTGTICFSNYFEQLTCYAILDQGFSWANFTGGGQWTFINCTFTGNDGMFVFSTAVVDTLNLYNCNFEQCVVTDMTVEGTVLGLTINGCRSEGLNGSVSFNINPTAPKKVQGVTVSGCFWQSDAGNADPILLGGAVKGFSVTGNVADYIGFQRFVNLNGAGEAGFIAGNYCENTPADKIVSTPRAGVVTISNYNSSGKMIDYDGTVSLDRATAPPVSGTYSVGSIVWNSAPSAGGTPGWVCVTAGTPGTWKAMANLAS